MIPLSGRVPGRASEPSQTRVDDGSYINFSGWRLGPLGFSQGCEFIGGRARSVGARGAHTMGGVARRGVVPPPCVAGSMPVFVSLLDPVNVSRK
jgi:hypothetical protein